MIENFEYRKYWHKVLNVSLINNKKMIEKYVKQNYTCISNESKNANLNKI